jgi:ABC-type polysaccharide/polyol phosphate export permease
MAAIIDGYRRAVLLGTAPDLPALAMGTVLTLALALVAFRVFKRAERTFADVI